MNLLGRLFFIGINLFISTSLADVVKVSLEPFPPLITKEGGGYTIEMLRAIEKVSDLRFDINITTYARAKLDLKNGVSRLIGHTPKGLEDPDFYQYAEELTWQIPVRTDAFVVDQKYFDFSLMKKGRLGVPTGNADFYSDLYKIPRDKFYEVSSVKQLALMLSQGKLDSLIFERASVMTEINALKIDGIFYKTFDVSADASLAVAKNPDGLMLKERIDGAIRKLDKKRIFKEYDVYVNMPKSGVVPVSRKQP